MARLHYYTIVDKVPSGFPTSIGTRPHIVGPGIKGGAVCPDRETAEYWRNVAEQIYDAGQETIQKAARSLLGIR